MSNASDVTSKLWEMANKLRGTMDASEYKNYILPFMFYRYLSENQDEYLADNYLEEFYEVTDPEEKRRVSPGYFQGNRLCDRSRVCLE